MKSFLVVLSLFLGANLCAQDSYVYIGLTADASGLSLDTTANIQLFDSRENPQEQVEPNVFRLKKNKNKTKFYIKIFKSKYFITLNKYQNNRFIEIYLYINPKAKEGDLTVKVMRGDVISVTNCSSSECHTARIQFSHIVVIDDEVMISGNKIFKKYIFK